MTAATEGGRSAARAAEEAAKMAAQCSDAVVGRPRRCESSSFEPPRERLERRVRFQTVKRIELKKRKMDSNMPRCSNSFNLHHYTMAAAAAARAELHDAVIAEKNAAASMS